MLFLNNDKEAADTSEWDCCSVCSRKQTNKGRAAEELAKSAATLTLPSKMLLMLRLLNKKRFVAAEEAAIATRQRSCSHLMMTQL